VDRALRICIAAAFALMLAGVAYLIVDSTGRREYEAPVTVVSVEYHEPVHTTTSIYVGQGVSVPIGSEMPASWSVVVESPLLGQQEISVSEPVPRVGQVVYVDYYIGRLSGAPYIGELRLQPRFVY
jgi:hypothetical protein